LEQSKQNRPKGRFFVSLVEQSLTQLACYTLKQVFLGLFWALRPQNLPEKLSKKLTIYG
jgi:hypothetical protein